MTFLGIDIGGTSVKVAALRDGRVFWTATSDRYARPTADEIAAAIRGAVAGRGAGTAGVGLCVPGLLDAQRRTVTLAVNLPGLQGVPLADLAAAATGGPIGRVVVGNDANAAAIDLYESRRLDGRLLVLVIGTGVGASVIDPGGRILRVDGDSPGHIGSIDVTLGDDANPVVGPDGGRGSLEGYLGVPALARRYGPDVPAAVDRLTVDDPPIRALVRTIRTAHAIYRPRHVCLAGGIGIRLGRLVPALRAAVSDQLTSVAQADWALTVGESDYHAAIGEARLAAHDEDMRGPQ